MAAQKGHKKHGGRKAGVPNRATASVREAAQQYTEEALNGLVAIMRDENSPAAARLAACREILDRGHGKPTQSIEGDMTMKHEAWLDVLEATDEQLENRIAQLTEKAGFQRIA